MITRIARGDVVRLIRTGEVGTVKGIAEHDDLQLRGTLLDVQISNEKRVTASGNALEFVANAKINPHPVAMWTVVALTLGVTGVVGVALADYGVPWLTNVMLCLMLLLSFDRTFTTMFLRPKKIKVRLPANRVSTERRTEAARNNIKSI